VDVTITVVTTADPLGRVVVEDEVTTTGGGVVMVGTVVELGLGAGEFCCVVCPPLSLQVSKSV
jgi:hypothetical protein